MANDYKNNRVWQLLISIQCKIELKVSKDSRKKKLWKIMVKISTENYQQLPCCKSTTK